MKKVSLLTALLAFACNAFSQVYQPEHWDGYLTFKVKNDSHVSIDEFFGEGTHAQFDTLIASFGIYRIKHSFLDTTTVSLRNCFFLQFNDSARMDTLISRLRNYPYLQYINKVGIGQYYEDVPTDSNYRFQWALQKVLVDSVWQLMPGTGKRIKIAVIDDAFLLGHQDLAAAIDTNYNDPINGFDDDISPLFNLTDDFLGWDFADNNNDVNPPPSRVRLKEYSHGTHCAIIAGGVSDNLHGTASLNRGNIKIIPIKNAPDAGWYPSVMANRPALEYAKNMGAQVISMSFQAQDSNLFDFMNDNPQIIFVVAAGNDGDSTKINTLGSYNLPNLICVGATNLFDEKAVYSTPHSSVDIMAPGSGIYSGLGTATNAYDYKSGTSQATPLVASICAAIWSYDTTLTAQEVIDRVLNTADNIDFENPDFTGQLGYGRINAYRAFNNITTQSYQAGFKTRLGRSLCSGDTLHFYARTYSNVRYVWNFGDGSTDTSFASDTIHIYNATGNHGVSLTLIDSSGNSLAHNYFAEYVSVTDCQPLTGERVQWFFGNGSGLDFRSGRPVPNTAAINNINASEASFSYCTPAGNLIFYGASGYAYHGNHTLIRNEPVLNGNPTQGYLPLMFNNKTHLIRSGDGGGGLYYFTYQNVGGTDSLSAPVPITVTNDTLHIAKNSDSSVRSDESVIAISNCSDGYWLFFNGYENDPNYASTLVVLKMEDSAGTPKFFLNDFAKLPSDGVFQNVLTKMKASPNGQYIAVANFLTGGIGNTGSISIFGFNQQTGKLDSLFWYPIGGVNSGLCFSPDSKLLYTSDPNTGLIYQLNLLDLDPYGTKGTVFSDKDFIDMQIASDGKLYLSKLNDVNLSVIDFPNNLNTFDFPNACGFRQSAIALNPGARTTLLPNYVDGQPPTFSTNDFSFRRTNCLNVEFLPSRTCDTSIVWYFGDSTYETAIRPNHTYAKAGIYNVVMINEQDTVKREVVVGLIGKIQGDTGICDTSYIYSFSTIKDDYYSYNWSVANGTILTDPTKHEIHTKFSQTGTLKVLVTDSRTGCVDSSLVQPTYGMAIKGNTIVLDSQPCLAYLSGTTLIPGAGTTSYLWQVGRDTLSWQNLDTLINQNAFVGFDSLIIRRKATNANCQSNSNYLSLKAKPQIVLLPKPAFVCDDDSVNYTDIEVSLNYWDSLSVWVYGYKKDSGDMAFFLVDSFEYQYDTLRNLSTRPGDSLYFTLQTDCGTVKSRTIGIPTLSQLNLIQVDSMPCFNGAPFAMQGNFLQSSFPLSYLWEYSLDEEDWNHFADTLKDFSGTHNYEDTIYYRRLITNGFCQSISEPLAIYPRIRVLSQDSLIKNCISSIYVIDLNIVHSLLNAPQIIAERSDGNSNFIPFDSFTFTHRALLLSLNDQDSVRFLIKTECGSFYSDTTVVFVCFDPDSFTLNPTPLVLNEDDSGFLFCSIAQGCGNTSGMETEWYLWQVSQNNGVSWSNVPDSNNDTLYLNQVQFCDNGLTYRVAYNNGCGENIVSSNAKLTVNKTNLADLWMKDYHNDSGNEPNDSTSWEFMDSPPDLWVRQSADGGTQAQNVQYPATNYVYYKIRNRGDDTSKQAELYLHWTLGGINGQNWPIAWQDVPGNRFTNLDTAHYPSTAVFAYGDSINRTAISIPPIAPGDSFTSYFEWTDAPNPLRYYMLVQGTYVYEQELGLCLLARLTTCDRDSFGFYRKETQRTADNVRNNNNIVLRNTRLINTNGQYGKNGTRMMVRTFDNEETIRLVAGQIGTCNFSTYGSIYMVLNDPLWQAWDDGGFMGSGFSMVGNNKIEVTDISQFELSNISLHPDSIGFIDFEFEVDSTITFSMYCVYYAAQYNGLSLDNEGVFTTYLDIQGMPIIVERNQVIKNDAQYTDPKHTLLFTIEAENESLDLPNTELIASVLTYPNPFNQALTIELNLPTESTVKIELYNALAQKVIGIENQTYNTGKHLVKLESQSLPPGMYWCTITLNGQTQTTKVVLSRE